jgi:hypothetical protein
MGKQHLFFVLALVAMGAPAYGAIEATQPPVPVKLGTVAFGGQACPINGTVPKVQATDDSYAVSGEIKTATLKAGGKSGHATTSQACEVTIPVEVTQGYQAALTGARFEGSYDLPAGSRATLHTERFVAGGTGMKHEQNIVPPASGLEGGYESEMAPEEAVWTSCNGGGYNLRASTRLVLNNEGRVKLASISLGKKGSPKSEMDYKVQWRRCR